MTAASTPAACTSPQPRRQSQSPRCLLCSGSLAARQGGLRQPSVRTAALWPVCLSACWAQALCRLHLAPQCPKMRQQAMGGVLQPPAATQRAKPPCFGLAGRTLVRRPWGNQEAHMRPAWALQVWQESARQGPTLLSCSKGSPGHFISRFRSLTWYRRLHLLALSLCTQSVRQELPNAWVTQARSKSSSPQTSQLQISMCSLGVCSNRDLHRRFKCPFQALSCLMTSSTICRKDSSCESQMK